MLTIKKLKNILPKKLTALHHFLVFLSVLTLLLIVSSAINAGIEQAIHLVIHLILLFAITSILYFVFLKISNQRKLFINTAISTLLVFLILDHSQSGASGIVVLILLMVNKFFFRYKNKQIFNPVAFGIVITTMAGLLVGFTMPVVSFDGALTSFNIFGLNIPIAFIFIILSTMANSIKRLKKLPMIASFLITSLIFMVLFNFDNAKAIIIATYSSPIIYFFIGALLIDPKTSPGKHKDQISFGIFAAISYVLLSKLNIFNPEIFTIFAANLYYVANRASVAKKKSSTS